MILTSTIELKIWKDQIGRQVAQVSLRYIMNIITPNMLCTLIIIVNRVYIYVLNGCKIAALLYWAACLYTYKLQILDGLRGYCTPNIKLACFVHYLQKKKKINYHHFLKNNISILKQIVQGTKKWHWKFSRPSSF